MRSMSRKFCAADLKKRLIFSPCNCRRKNLRSFDLRLTCDPPPPPFYAVSFSSVSQLTTYCTAEGNLLLVRKRVPLIRWPSPEIHIMETERTLALDTGGYKEMSSILANQ